MAWQSGGGGGYPGVTSDGNQGLTIARALQAGDATASVAPDQSVVHGTVVILDTQGNLVDGDELFIIGQSQPLPLGADGEAAVRIQRAGDLTHADYIRPMVRLEDLTNSAQPVVRVRKNGVTVLELNTIRSITGALSTVADAPAKAVLTSIIAALTGISVATNNTT